VWKVHIARQRYWPHNFDAFDIFTIKFSKSLARNIFQTFQSGIREGFGVGIGLSHKNSTLTIVTI
jgi:hypothetical protein